jgi:hypothetical protein
VRLRRSVLWIATFAVVVGVVELFSCAALRVTTGSWIGLDELAEARERAGAGERGGALGAEAAGTAPAREGRLLHPYLGYVMDPRLAEPGIGRAGLDRLSVELGFPRNREPVLQAPDSARFVVGVFGGSVADVLAVAGADALREALADAPAAAGREIVVLSLAAPGYKQPQPLMTLNYLLLLGAHFDAVVNLDGVNDLALPASELAPLDVAPFYPHGWYTRAADLSPDLRLALGRAAVVENLRRRNANAFSWGLLRSSYSAGLLFHLVDRALEKRLGEAEAAVLARPAGRRRQAQGPFLPPDRGDLVVDVWRRSSLQMARLCDGLGIRYFHFLQPNQYVPGSKPMDESERSVAIADDSPVREPVETGYPLLRAAGERLIAKGVRFHDLSDVFADVSEPVYLDNCCHLNERGNELLGAAVGRAMAAAE